ncbi:sensor histidine kinase YesM [Clostridium acetobutylicum]|uniref:Membrane associated histidine kinase-like ATPase n=1 Tax=Clostridium acetobutylicum (strain ATCC 824 / DSM 792 / JCM 1419 / IAM 19013 / LMG 5710 / NBRC 13948 / NRRL B-527 / VKM B-1787 / 2291 / W) TaxID=272562 RepID=Q97IQ8_CLOAB|nr:MULTISPECIES: sensor histidine kinase [Clostridium]AAK79549.1 Membrane associated histidine kinase-like ATPase [Clostridium acetobutylicum ATCC 824]ADZ20634.1 Membrane associated histidine kinase-like ATPase [Clostridium acetobutylicum EA 2018]AEI31880.1 membrane associated histidine kinase-like ATPase [Clostridium acetobutylicum DSM 1731]AWV81208.1 sensor histidine kinase [Clostridium acetobutylicum]MBC2392839.1 sensor histidine kinase [Clostridium acetobutylicum]
MNEIQIYINSFITNALLIAIKYYFYREFLGFSKKRKIYLFFVLEIIVSIISNTVSDKLGFKSILIIILIEIIIIFLTCRGKSLVKIYSVMLIENILILISLTFLIVDFKIDHVMSRAFINKDYLKIFNLILINFRDILNEIFLFMLLKCICSILKIKNSELNIYKQLYLVMPCISIYGISFLFYNVQLVDTGKGEYYLPEIFSSIYCMLPFIGLFLILSIFIAAYTFQKMLDGEEEREKSILMQQQLNLQFEHNKNIQNLYKNTRGVMHDINKHINCLRNLAYSDNIDVLKNYLNNISETIKKLDFIIKTGNAVADAVINEKYTIAKNEGIELYCDFIMPEKAGIEPIDLSIILNNSLDNAIEACRKIKNLELHKRISIKSIVKNSFLIIEISNSCEEGIKYCNNNIISTKKSETNHGIGISNIKEAVKKYSGTFDIKEEKNMVILNIMVSI